MIMPQMPQCPFGILPYLVLRNPVLGGHPPNRRFPYLCFVSCLGLRKTRQAFPAGRKLHLFTAN